MKVMPFSVRPCCLRNGPKLQYLRMLSIQKWAKYHSRKLITCKPKRLLEPTFAEYGPAQEFPVSLSHLQSAENPQDILVAKHISIL